MVKPQPEKWASLALAAVVSLGLVSVPARAQFPAESTIPKAKRRHRPLAKAPIGPTPRTKDGKPDLSGVWGYAGYTSDIAKDYDVGELPMTALGDKLFKERQANQGVEDPEARCQPTGVPRRDPYPSKIIQEPNLVVILFEGNLHSYRQIFINGTHPTDPNPSWWGYSTGKWDGDELVVDTIGFNGKTWLDLAGHPASDQLHVIERYSRPDFGHLKNVITIEDPVMYTRPWNVTEITPLMTSGDLMEYVCTENERDVQHLNNLIKLYHEKGKP
ncbi:MAG TPA: hypothetical protein VFW83_05675 [Bryobacteraceae bacterium]|nr:hypothetical protein [Bryobacteraceae bacterium]